MEIYCGKIDYNHQILVIKRITALQQCKLCGEQYVGQTSNKFSKRWNSHRSSWDTVILSNDQEQMPLLHHVVHEHKIEKKPKISECFIVTFVEQPSYDYLDICKDKWINKISASINKHRMKRF